MASTSNTGILSLPKEVLMMILEPMLCHSPAQLADDFWWRNDPEYWRAIDRSFARPYTKYKVATEDQDFLEVQLLRVCKVFHQVGASVLYNSTLIVLPYSLPMSVIPKSGPFVIKNRELCDRLARPRTHRFRKVCFVVLHGGGDFPYSIRPRGGDRFDGDCAALARHQPCWDRATMLLTDRHSGYSRFCTRDTLTMMFYGLGQLHCREAAIDGFPEPARDDLLWAMKRPGKTAVLWPIYVALLEYLDTFDDSAKGSPQGVPLWRLSDFFRKEAFRATEANDHETFVLILEGAVEYVKTVALQALSPATTSIPDSSYADSIVHRVMQEGDSLLKAKDGQWSSLKISAGRPHVTRPSNVSPYHDPEYVKASRVAWGRIDW